MLCGQNGRRRLRFLGGEPSTSRPATLQLSSNSRTNFAFSFSEKRVPLLVNDSICNPKYGIDRNPNGARAMQTRREFLRYAAALTGGAAATAELLESIAQAAAIEPAA